MDMLKILGVLIVAASVSQASVVVWGGGSGSWSDANWSVDGSPATNTYGSAITDQVFINSGSVTASGDLVAQETSGTADDYRLTVGGTAQLTINGMLEFGYGKAAILRVVILVSP